jgi:2-polyprenyl-3-methyl-5-hydroxy-6-metoxy-1,4-benzoquinol methylase
MTEEIEAINFRREHVLCALCGQDRAVVKYAIPTRNLRHAGVWVADVYHPVDGTATIVACTVCGLIYTDPRLVLEPGAMTYDTTREREYFENSYEIRRWAYAHLVRQFPIWLGRQPRTLLDVGCGDGALLEAAHQVGINGIGTESSKILAQLVRERLGDAAVTSADLSDLRGSSFDVATLINVLEHVRDPRDILESLARLLEPNSILVVHVPNVAGLPALLRGPNWHQIEPLEHLYYFTVHTLTALLERTGFEVIGRFSIVISKRLTGWAQRLLGRIGIYIDSGLGIVARRSTRS